MESFLVGILQLSFQEIKTDINTYLLCIFFGEEVVEEKGVRPNPTKFLMCRHLSWD